MNVRIVYAAPGVAVVRVNGGVPQVRSDAGFPAWQAAPPARPKVQP